MTTFDKCCAVMTIPIGVVFMILGVMGLFAGSSANFTLPPVLGVLPFFVGWSMCVSLIRYWRSPKQQSDEEAERRLYHGLFLKFMHLHPELRMEPDEIKWQSFHRWLENRWSAVGPQQQVMS